MKRKLAHPPRQTAGAPGRRVPRPVDKWLSDFVVRWQPADPEPDWLPSARSVASRYGCDVVFDLRRHLRESCYSPSAPGAERPLIRLGGAGATKQQCLSVFTHELGHHLLRVRRQQPDDLTVEERAAWKAAHEVALEHGLPVLPEVRRLSLHSYRQLDVLAAQPGTKGKTKVPRPPRSARLESSRRSSVVSGGKGSAPLGKKGRRHVKRDLKRRAAKAIRRARDDE